MDLLELSEKEYTALEEALMASARGRAFLRQRDRQTRLVSQDDWRQLMRALTEQVTRLSAAGGGAGAGIGPDALAQNPHLRIMREELKELSNYIEQTRQEIAQLRPVDAGTNRIIAATNELDAIVTATERATSDILNAAERIQALVGRLPPGEVASDIEMQTIEIMTACSFQDITGQRTNKVVNTLRYIEQRVNTMIEIWGTGDADGAGSSQDALIAIRPDDHRPDRHLLHGPSEGGVSQDNIDALFDLPGAAAPVTLEAQTVESPPPAEEPGDDWGAALEEAAEAPPPPPPPPPPPKPAANTTVSQADIDALFG